MSNDLHPSTSPKPTAAMTANGTFAAGTFADVVTRETFYRDLEGNSLTTTAVDLSPPVQQGQNKTSGEANQVAPPVTREHTEDDGWRTVRLKKQTKRQGVADSMHAPFRALVQASQVNPSQVEIHTRPLPGETPQERNPTPPQTSLPKRTGGTKPNDQPTTPPQRIRPRQPTSPLTVLDSDGDSIMGDEQSSAPLPIRFTHTSKGKGPANSFPSLRPTKTLPTRASSNPPPRPVSPDSVFAAPTRTLTAQSATSSRRTSPRTLAEAANIHATRRSASPRNVNPPPRAVSRPKSRLNNNDDDFYWEVEDEITEEEIHLINEAEAKERNRKLPEQLKTPTKHKRRTLESIVIDDQGSPSWSHQTSHVENFPPSPAPGPSRATPFATRLNATQHIVSDHRTAGNAHPRISNSPLPPPPLPRFTKNAPTAPTQPTTNRQPQERSTSPRENTPDQLHERDTSQTAQTPHIKIERDPTAYIPPTMHVPKEICIAEIPFAYPTEGWQEPIGNDPWFFRDNLVVEQVDAWEVIGEKALLIRQAGESYPDDTTEGSRKYAIKEILEMTLGPLPNLYLIAPNPENTGDKNFEPPFAFLARGLSPEEMEGIKQYRCISSSKGTLFITPNRADIPDYVMSLSGFDITNNNAIIESINHSWDRANLNEEIAALLPTHDELCNVPPDEAIQYVRESLRVQVVTAKTKAQIPYHIVHIYLESPTSAPLKWRAFRNFVLAISYRDPLISMHIAKYNQWTCKMCHSKIHPTGLCPMLGERGWYIPPELARQASQQAAPPARPSAPSAFSSIQSANGNKGKKGKKQQYRNNKNQKGGKGNN